MTAKIFADCSGDSVLAPITGAEFRMGRESRDEFGEDIAPVVSDNHTMGMSCLLQVRETDREIPFRAPDWAVKFTDETIGHRVNINNPRQFVNDNFWWIELGGMDDAIGDTEKLRDRLLPITFGVWDYYKNSGRFDSKNWELEWVGFLPGKRESRRYVGAHILTQNEVRDGGRFDDLIAYGGWSMDDHHPAGFDTTEAPTYLPSGSFAVRNSLSVPVFEEYRESDVLRAEYFLYAYGYVLLPRHGYLRDARAGYGNRGGYRAQRGHRPGGGLREGICR